MKKKLIITSIIILLIILTFSIYSSTLHGKNKLAYEQITGTFYAFDNPSSVELVRGKPEDDEMGYYELKFLDKNGNSQDKYYFISIDDSGKYWLYEEKGLEEAQYDAHYTGNINVDKINKHINKNFK